MAKDAFDILDTAVKIGLGALISGITTYYLTKLNNKNAILKEQRENSSILKKEKREKRAKLAEQCIENVDPFLTAFSNFLAAIDGSVKSGKFSEDSTDSKTKCYLFIRKYDQELTDSRVHYHACVSKLNLIGFKDSRLALNRIIKHEGKIRKKIMFNKEVPTQEDVDKYMSEFQELKDCFYDTLSKEFDDVFKDDLDI